MAGHPRAGGVDSAPGRSMEQRSVLFAEHAVRPLRALTAELAQPDPSLQRVRQRTVCWNQLSPVDGFRQADDGDRVAIQLWTAPPCRKTPAVHVRRQSVVSGSTRKRRS